MVSSAFVPCDPRIWRGRYNRIPGDASVFHLRYYAPWKCFWPVCEWPHNGELLLCWFAYSDAVLQMTRMVVQAKQESSGVAGGAFLINEWGQVIVPNANEWRRRYYVGRLQGDWHLVDPWEPSRLLSLKPEPGLQLGQRWNRPYIGIPYRLSKFSKIYFVDRLPGEDRIVHPRIQDERLVAALRRIRKWGPMSFIVNPFGAVIAKRPVQGVDDEELWEPVYVGKVDLTKWFDFQEG